MILADEGLEQGNCANLSGALTPLTHPGCAPVANTANTGEFSFVSSCQGMPSQRHLSHVSGRHLAARSSTQLTFGLNKTPGGDRDPRSQPTPSSPYVFPSPELGYLTPGIPISGLFGLPV